MRQRKRIAALLLSAAMVLQTGGSITLTAEDRAAIETSSAVCTHHTHDEACGYAEAIPSADCTHLHNDVCGFVEAVAEIPCDKDCTDADGDGNVDHVEDCAYTPAVEGVDCDHRHDEECGYIEGREGSPCTFVCEICGKESAEPEKSACICEVPCTEEAVNADCPVCGEKSADLAACEGELEQAQTVTITSFDKLAEDVGEQIVEAGTELENLNLPHTLGASGYVDIQDASNPESFTIEGVTWESDPPYDESAEQGAYLFTAKLPEGYTLAEGVALPEIGVMVSGKNLLAEAADIKYLDENGTEQTCPTAAEVTADNTQWETGWYVVNSKTTLSSRVQINGEVYLILEDGCTLDAPEGIQVEGDNSLTIYGQKNGTGKLTANGSSQSAGIGGDAFSNGGIITINGGTVKAAGEYGAGIGGGFGGAGGTITINSGTVEAKGNYSAGIGGGDSGAGGIITINGGAVKAESTYLGTGIGGGNGGAGGTIAINGGTVEAAGNYGAGIGGGFGSGGDYGSGGDITISGGTVTASSTSGAGIGSGDDGSGNGSFTADGNGVIFASSISDQGDKDNWSGVIVEDNQGQLYGTEVTPTEDFTIPEGTTVTIPEGSTLTIDQDITLTIDGTLENNGTLKNNGTIHGEVSNKPAVTAVSYQTCDEDGQNWRTEKCTNYIKIDENHIPTIWNKGWYVVSGNITIPSPSRVQVNGEVHLILEDGCTLDAPKGIQVEGSNSLTIYGQENGTGKLTATGEYYQAGIGGGNSGDGGTVTINGGNVTATGGDSGAGIGGGYWGSGGTVTINGGNVTAAGGMNSAGIGGGYGGDGGMVTINGGSIEAAGGTNGAGIGGGYAGSGGTVTINGGSVTATEGNKGTGIGNGYMGSGGSFTAGGNGVIFASSISDQDGKDNWNGVIVEDNQGQLYGTNVAPTEDFTIPEGTTVTIPEGSTLDIQGVNAVNEGTIRKYGAIDGTFQGNGSILVLSAVTVTFHKNGSTVTEAAYGDTIDVLAVMAPKDNTNRAAAVNTVDFYLDSVADSSKLGTIEVKGNQATLPITLSGDKWTIANYTIIADFGGTTGSGGLMENRGEGQLTVNQASIEDAVVQLSEKTEFTYNGKPQAPDVTVTLKNGTALTKDDYRVSYTRLGKETTDRTNVGEVAVSVTGNGNCTGVADEKPTFTIKQAELSIKAKDQEIVHGQSIQTDLSQVEVIGLVEGEELLQITLTPNTAGGTITPSNPVISGGGADNYKITCADGKLTITDKQQQADFQISSVGSKIYGDAAFPLSTTGGSGTGKVTFESSDESILSISGATATIQKAGTVTITAKKAADNDYNEAVAPPLDLTIGKRPLTVTGAEAKDRVYDGTKKITVTKVTLGGVAAGDTDDDVRIDTTDLTGTIGSADVGDYDEVTLHNLTLTGDKADCYSLNERTKTVDSTVKITQATVDLDSLPKDCHINIANRFEKEYDYLLSLLCPKLNEDHVTEDRKDWGERTYEIVSVDFGENTGYFTPDTARIDKTEDGQYENRLYLPILSNDVDTTGEVGTVTIRIISKNYASFENTISIKATNKEAVTFPDLTLPDKTYDGEPYEYEGTITVKDLQGNEVTLTSELEITYAGRGDTGYSERPEPPTNAGEFAMIVRVADTDKDYIGRHSYNFTIKKAPGVGSVTMKDFVEGQEPSVPVPASDTNGVAGVEYSYKVKGADDSTYLSDKPTAAGEYTVRAIFPETLNYTAATATADFRILSEGAFTITFDGNGGTTPDAQTTTDGKLTALPQSTRSGYTFNGWYTDKSGGEKVTRDTVFTADTTVYAQWDRNSSSSGSDSDSSSSDSDSDSDFDSSSDSRSSSRENREDLEDDFWQEVWKKIKSAGSGDIVKINARGCDKMPGSVMRALRENSGITLVIRWDGGEDIVIPAGKAQPAESLRIYYPLSLLAKLYAETEWVAPETGDPETDDPVDLNAKNPVTGGPKDPDATNPVAGNVWEVSAPITTNLVQSQAGELQITDPRRGLAETPELAEKGIEKTIPGVFEPDVSEKSSVSTGSENSALIAVLAVLAAAVAGGWMFWKKRKML